MRITSRKILVLAANPRGTVQLKLKEEENNIVNVLNRAKQRDNFELLPACRGVTPREIQEKILNQEPHIVHFSGHGSGNLGISLEDSMGNEQLVPTEALAGLFEICGDVECVILNACYSEVQAIAISRHVPYVIGMNDAISDRAALEFTFGFYSALGSGKSYEIAYKAGINAIAFQNILQTDLPVLKIKKSPDEFPTLWIHGWDKQNYDGKPTEELDWTGHYSRNPSVIPSPEVWTTQLLPQLHKIKQDWSTTYRNRHISLRGKLPLSVGVAIGSMFSSAAGYSLDVEQSTPGQGSSIWRSDKASGAKFEVAELVEMEGDELLMVFSVSRDAKIAVQSLIQESSNQFKRVVYAIPEGGIAANSVSGAEDAVALAISGKRLIDQYRSNGEKVHIILVAPFAFAVFLGQQLNALGEVIVYEYTLDTNKYQVAMQWITS